jgi:hypothetical protein
MAVMAYRHGSPFKLPALPRSGEYCPSGSDIRLSMWSTRVELSGNTTLVSAFFDYPGTVAMDAWMPPKANYSTARFFLDSSRLYLP